MHTVDSNNNGAIDTVHCVSVSVKNPHTGEAPTIQANLVYMNKKSGTTFGTCPIQNTLLSKESLNLLTKFMESVEIDFGNIVFEGGALSVSSASPVAETVTGLSERGMGGPK